MYVQQSVLFPSQTSSIFISPRKTFLASTICAFLQSVEFSFIFISPRTEAGITLTQQSVLFFFQNLFYFYKRKRGRDNPLQSLAIGKTQSARAVVNIV